MPTLKRTKSGGYSARARIPEDVRQEYGRQFGKRHEAKFFAPAGTQPADAKRLYGEWLAEHEARVASIRAARDGTGSPLTHRQAHLLAAEWYRWYVARHRDSPGTRDWDGMREVVQEILTDATLEGYAHSDDDWPQAAIDAALPRVADDAETQQFLAHQRLTLSREGQRLFLRAVFEHYAEALRRLHSYARGDYSPDQYVAKLPPPEKHDSGETPWALFNDWIAARQPAQSTIETWRYILRDLADRFEGRSAASISPDDARAWLIGSISEERSAETVSKNWRRAAHTVFEWATHEGRIAANPFTGLKFAFRPKARYREEKSYRETEISTILRAALAIVDTDKPDEAAKRWVHWLLAYSGARPGEITQLRARDVAEQDGIMVLRLTPEAGTIKNRTARSVPLHEHIIAQGFLEWVKTRGDGPLFYRVRNATNAASDAVKKSPGAQARQRLAKWVRSLGVTDPELSPNHAWRHTFKVHGRRAGISDKILDDICGHAPLTQGRAYGPTPLRDRAAELSRFPRYEIQR